MTYAQVTVASPPPSHSPYGPSLEPPAYLSPDHVPYTPPYVRSTNIHNAKLPLFKHWHCVSVTIRLPERALTNFGQFFILSDLCTKREVVGSRLHGSAAGGLSCRLRVGGHGSLSPKPAAASLILGARYLERGSRDLHVTG